MDGGKEPVAPGGRAAADIFSAGGKDDKGGQVGAFAAEAIGRPGAETRSAGERHTGVHLDLARRVIAGIGVHRPDDRQIIRDLSKVGEQFGKLRAGVAVPRELVLRPEQKTVRIIGGGRPPIQHRSGKRLALPTGQFGLVIEQLKLARRAAHIQINHPFGLGGEGRQPRGERVGGGGKGFLLAQQFRQRDGTETDATLIQKSSAGERLDQWGPHGRSKVY